MQTLKEVFDEHFSKVKFDEKLGKALYQYQITYINSNKEYLQFYGSNLLGVHVLRFKDSDVNRLFDEVLKVDYDNLKVDIRKLTTIDHTYLVSADILNLTLFYVLHRYLIETSMDQVQRERAAYDTCLIFFYRTIAALTSYFFRYPADPKIAQAAYANLSNKFLIKRLGSWHKVVDYRAKDLSGKDGVNYRKLISFEDTGVVEAINDSQGRIRDMYKNYYGVFKSAHTNGEGISVTSGTYIDAEGEETVKEKTKSIESYVAYMRNIIIDKHTFLKDELVSIVLRINANTSFRIVKNTITWLCDNYGDPKQNKIIDEFLSLTVVQSMYMMQNNIDPKNHKNYPLVLVTLKNLYLSTRTTDPEIDRIRELGLKIVHEANGKGISNALALSTRTSVILYLSLRSLIGQNANRL